MYNYNKRYYESLYRRVALLESLILESDEDKERLKNYLGDSLYDAYMSIRDRIPSNKDLLKSFPNFSDNDDINDPNNINLLDTRKQFIKKYLNIRKHRLINDNPDFLDLPSNITLDDANDYLADYHRMRNHVLSTYNNFRNFEDLKALPKNQIEDFVSKFTTIRSSKQEDIAKYSRRIYSDDDWDVYKVFGYPAARELGKGTRWCITGRYEGHEERGEEYFNKYINQNKLDGGYYFYINKKDPSMKFCVLQQENGKILSIWDASDTNMGKKSVDLPIDLPEVEGVNLKRAKSKKDLLLRAINHDDGLAIKKLLDDGVNPNTTYKGTSALRLAIDKESCNAVDALLAGGADADSNNNGWSLIDDACRMANDEVGNKIVRSLLKYKYSNNIDESNNIDDRTFNTICQYCNYLTVKAMLDLGYTPNDGSLWSAIEFLGPGKSRVVELLLSAGADPNVRNSYDETVLSKLLKMRSKNKDVIEAIRVLRDYGATE